MTSIKEKTLILVPAYNEEERIENVLKDLRRYGFVIVIDDGSTDNTSKLALKQGCIVLKHSRNLGKAQAINTARKFMANYWDIFKDFQSVVIADADGQHKGIDCYNLSKAIIE